VSKTKYVIERWFYVPPYLFNVRILLLETRKQQRHLLLATLVSELYLLKNSVINR